MRRFFLGLDSKHTGLKNLKEALTGVKRPQQASKRRLVLKEAERGDEEATRGLTVAKWEISYKTAATYFLESNLFPLFI